MNSMTRPLLVALSFALILLLPSCDLDGGSGDDDPPTAPPTTPPTDPPITPPAAYEWSALGSGVGVLGDFNEALYALALDGDGNLYAGGTFSTAGGVATTTVAKWNGTAWSALDDGICPSGNDYV